MLKREATVLVKRIHREEPNLKAAPHTYGHGLWTVFVICDETVSEYCTADMWADRKPARTWPSSQLPQPIVSADVLLAVLKPRANMSPKVRSLLEKAREKQTQP